LVTILSTVIENLPAVSVSPPLGLLLKVILTFCNGTPVAESTTLPIIVFVCAELNWANKTAITNMVMHLFIWIAGIYSKYALNKLKDANLHLSGWLS
jgi:hypothetical protein